MYLTISDEIKYPRLYPIVRDICLHLRSINFEEKLNRYLQRNRRHIDNAMRLSMQYGYPPRIVVGTFFGTAGMAIPDPIRNLNNGKLRVSTPNIDRLHKSSIQEGWRIYQQACKIFEIILHEYGHCLRWYSGVSSFWHMLTIAEEEENVKAVKDLFGISEIMYKDYPAYKANLTKEQQEELNYIDKYLHSHSVSSISRKIKMNYYDMVPIWQKDLIHLKARLEYEKAEAVKIPYDYRNR